MVDFLPFLKIGFSLAPLQALENIPWEIRGLQISLIGLDKILAPSFRNLPGSLSIPEALEISIFPLS